MIERRAGSDRGGQRLMVNDNPAWPDALLPAGAEIVGQVVWCVLSALWIEREANRRARFRTGVIWSPSLYVARSFGCKR